MLWTENVFDSKMQLFSRRQHFLPTQRKLRPYVYPSSQPFVIHYPFMQLWSMQLCYVYFRQSTGSRIKGLEKREGGRKEKSKREGKSKAKQSCLSSWNLQFRRGKTLFSHINTEFKNYDICYKWTVQVTVVRHQGRLLFAGLTEELGLSLGNLVRGRPR